MKHSLKFFRCSCVLLLALIVAFSATIGVAATDNIYLKFQGVVINSNNVSITDLSSPAFAYNTPILRISGNFDSNTVYSFAISVNDYNSLEGLSITKAFVTDNNLTSYQPLSGQNLTDYSYNNIYYNGNNKTIIITFNTANLDFTSTRYIYFQFDTLSNNTSTRITVVSNSYYQEDTEQIIASNSINTKLDSVSNTINNTINDAADQIESSINNIDTDSIILILENIYNYGNTYNQIDSILIGNLGTAEDQLSSAEDALENKSQSLKDSVSSQWQNIKSTSRTFITNIAPAAAAIGTVTTQFMDAAPQEVKGLFVTIPLLIFIGWLIGRIRGD